MKRLFTFLLALTCVAVSFAYDCVIDGIYYNLNSTEMTAEVTNETGRWNAMSYSGSVVIPEIVTYDNITYSVTTIGYYAFSECSGLTSITIPNSVTEIGYSAFSGCSSLPVVDNLRYADTYLIEAVDKTLSTYTIKDGTKWIGDEAFKDYTSLNSMTIPNSVTTIGTRSFYNCEGLTSVTIGNSVTTIGYMAFSECSGLTSITIPNSVTTIRENAFAYCRGLISVTIPNSITTIESSTFWDCSSLTSVTIPNSVTSIGGSAFYGCSGLTSITIPNSVTSIGHGAFHSCISLLSPLYNATIFAYLPESYEGAYTIPNGIEQIAGGAFGDCESLTSVIIPNSVTTIGNYAFDGCSGLISPVYNANCFAYLPQSYNGAYTIPNGIKQIAGGAFYDCEGLTSVSIPNSVTTIGYYAFEDCSGLTSVTIPNSVTTIEERAFYWCQGLTSVAIGNSVTTIGDDAFYGCSSLTSVTCYATIPPKCNTAFSDIKWDANVYVIASALTDYQNAEGWKDLQLYPIAAEVTPMDDENPVVIPSDQDVTITWPITDGTDTYTLTITKNGEVVCVLTFNANGQLTNIAFAAPGHNGAHQAPAATLTAQGYQFTVTGLNPGTAYDYSVTATDAGGKTLAEHKGNFSTTGETGLNTLPYEGKDGIGSKYFHNGNLIIERNGVKYTPAGQKVR